VREAICEKCQRRLRQQANSYEEARDKRGKNYSGINCADLPLCDRTNQAGVTINRATRMDGLMQRVTYRESHRGEQKQSEHSSKC
jgi:hypothetical protein